jgi:hypothetical protein
MNYQDLAPQERMVLIAKIYHNIWYDESRFAIINNLLEDWEKEPVKEAKYLNQIHNGTEVCEGNIFN